MPGLEFIDVLEDAAIAGHVAIREILFERARVEAALHAGIREDRLQFTGEEKAIAAGMIENRLDAQPIPGDKDLPPRSVPDRECEHAPQVVDAARSMLLVEMDDHLGVRVRFEDVPAGDQLLTQLDV